MKAVKLFIGLALAFVAVSASAQDLSAPQYAKWGETIEQREKNILASQYLKSEVQNRDFNKAAMYLQQLIKECPNATQNTYILGTTIYKNKINSARSLEERKVYVDSLFLMYDLRLEHFGSHPKYGKAYILDRKAREYMTYNDSDREGIRKIFEEAIAAQIEVNGTVDPTIVATYFANLCEDYKNDVPGVDAMTIMTVYGDYAKYFENLDESQAQLKTQFDTNFGMSGAASCDNLQKIFEPKLAANPNDEALLSQAFQLLFKANCESDFALSVAEKYYAIKPQSSIAMLLAQIFQSKQEYAKASKYLREALASETDSAERGKLLVRIGILEFSTKNYGAAIKSFNDSLGSGNDGLALYFLAQCYVAGSAGCGSSIPGRSVYWYAYDVVSRAIPLLEATDAKIAAEARSFAGRCRAAFPSAEECFFAELGQGSRYTVACGLAKGKSTTVRYR